MINAQDNDGRTSFHLAIINVQKFENLLPLKELYAKGALLDVKDNQGLSPLDLIASQSDSELRDQLYSFIVIDLNHNHLIVARSNLQIHDVGLLTKRSIQTIEEESQRLSSRDDIHVHPDGVFCAAT